MISDARSAKNFAWNRHTETKRARNAYPWPSIKKEEKKLVDGMAHSQHRHQRTHAHRP